MFGRDVTVDVRVVRGMWPSSRKGIRKRETTRTGFYTQHQFHYQPTDERDRQEAERPEGRVTPPCILTTTSQFAHHGTSAFLSSPESQILQEISQSIMEYNGGSVVAMVGKGCVAIASDLRLGNQALGISSNFQKVCMLSCSS